jgi:hypothetical protein
MTDFTRECQEVMLFIGLAPAASTASGLFSHTPFALRGAVPLGGFN